MPVGRPGLIVINELVSKKLNLMVWKTAATMVRQINILVGVVRMTVIKKKQILVMLVTGVIEMMMRVNMILKNPS